MKKFIFLIFFFSIPASISANEAFLLQNIHPLPQDNITYKNGDREYFSPQKISLFANGQKLSLGEAFISTNRGADYVSQTSIPESWSALYEYLEQESFENYQKYNGILFYSANTWCEDGKMKYDWEKYIRTCQNGKNIVTLQGTKVYNTVYTSKSTQETIFQIFPLEPIGIPFQTESKRIGVSLPQYILMDDAHVSGEAPFLEFTQGKENISLSPSPWEKKYRVLEYNGSRIIYPYYESKLSIPEGTYQLKLNIPFSSPVFHIGMKENDYHFSF